MVFLVGAGPGHPDLVTLRAVECLRQADLVLYDKLVHPSLLDFAPASARRICVTELAPEHRQRHVPVHECMIEAARRGEKVVRLKGGDPSIFGRMGEEAQVLKNAGVLFEIVPGITTALGAAAYAGIPLTHRDHASAVAFVAGHENPEKPASVLDWDALARFPGTLVVYMGVSRIGIIVRELLKHGKDSATPAASVHLATTGLQHTVEATLADLPGRIQREGLSAPAILIIGPVVSLRHELTWFESRPLFGRRVLVTRPRHQAGDLVHRLLHLGAVPFSLPAVEIKPPQDWTAIDAALDRLGEFDWLVFTSVNGVESLLNRLLSRGQDLRALGRVKLAVIGPKTAEALERFHLRADLMPARFQSEDLAAAILQNVKPGERILLARADRGRELLRDELSKTCRVEQVAVYSQVDAVEADPEVLDHLRRGEIEFITLTSSNIARSLIGQLDDVCRDRIRRGEVKLVSISPVTTAEVRRLGFEITAEATEATMDGMLVALVAACSPLSPREDIREKTAP